MREDLIRHTEIVSVLDQCDARVASVIVSGRDLPTFTFRGDTDRYSKVNYFFDAEEVWESSATQVGLVGSVLTSDFYEELRIPDLLNKASNQADPFADCVGLEYDWDNRGAEPLSPETIAKGRSFYAVVESLIREHASEPEISPGLDDFIEFLWRKPEKGTRLEIWLYGQGKFYSEFCIARGRQVLNEGQLHSIEELADLVKTYLN